MTLTLNKLKPPCVNLSSVALRFRTRDASVKEVLHALEEVRDTLSDLGTKNRLDPRLAEYALFPLVQQVFNETKRLSPRCLEVAIGCVTILVANGYKQALVPKLGKELLILMSMLAGAGNISENQAPPDELKIAAFSCISEIIKALSTDSIGSDLFDDQGTKNIVDQLVYLLLEAIVDSQPEQTQIAASEVLLQLIKAIKNRVFLASLLPRTISSLTKALRLSTSIRRTKKVLITNLKVFRVILDRTLSDRVALSPTGRNEKETLGESWLKATSTQIKNALLQVVNLRNHESPDVRRALEELCIMVLENCRTTLMDSISAILETMVVLCAKPESDSAKSSCRHMLIAYPENADIVKTSLSTWSRSLPRIMQKHDEQQKVSALQRLTASFQILTDSGMADFIVTNEIMTALVSGISNALQDGRPKALEIYDKGETSYNAFFEHRIANKDFSKFILDHESQRDTLQQLRHLINILKWSSDVSRMRRYLVDYTVNAEGSSKLASFWLALQLLKNDTATSLTVGDFLVSDVTNDRFLDRSSQLADLHAITMPILGSVFDNQADEKFHWQMQALAMECVVIYAQTFEGDSYRTELMDTLYPVLSFLGSPNTILRSHAMIALDSLAISCQYSSTTEMILDNNDYLVNSIAWKLNTYNLSPEAPQVLRMVVQLCGSELIPYLDDLIQSIFAALDTYHGYPEWVEILFRALQSMVDVSAKCSRFAITFGKDSPVHEKSPAPFATRDDLFDDLSSRKRRKIDFDRPAEEPPTVAPRRPWTDRLDGPSFPDSTAEDEEFGENDGSNEHLSDMKPAKDEQKELSKPHSLLISIAKSTIPHLASPSPQVRHLILDLLRDIAPLLGRDENSFLPLINSIWHVLVPRLFAEQANSDSENGGEETAYNISAAADTIAVLCVNAGDFMSSRIEDLFQQLRRLFMRISNEVNIPRRDADIHTSQARNTRSMAQNASGNIQGPVDLEIIAKDRSEANPTDDQLRSGSLQRTTRTSKSQILSSLVNLLVAILKHVRLTLDTSDAIMQMLLPLMPYSHGIRNVLDIYNDDAVWFWDHRTQARWEAETTSGNNPVLREALEQQGIALVQSESIAVSPFVNTESVKDVDLVHQ